MSTARSHTIGVGAKLSVFMTVILLLLGAVTALFVSRSMSDVLRREFESKGSTIARSVAMSAEELLLSARREGVQGKLDQFKEVGGVRYVVVLGAKGDVIGHTLPSAFPPELGVRLLSASAADGGDRDTKVELAVNNVGHVLDIGRPVYKGALGSAHVGMDLDWIEAQSRDVTLSIVSIFTLFIGLAVGASIFAGRLVVRPLYELVATSKAVSRGDLAVRAQVQTRDEFASLSYSFDTMLQSLRGLVDGVRGASVRVSESAEEILASSRSQEQGVSDQTVSIDEVTRSMDALTDTAHAIARRTGDLSTLNQRMTEEMRNAQAAVSAARTAMQDIAERNVVVDARVQELYEQSRSIIHVIDIIDGISDRLDLLALNAALEGARAGDLGKGFSLVAQEMRRLAESVMVSTREVKETVQSIHTSTQASIEASRESTTSSKNGVSEVEKMVVTTRAMFELIDQAVDASQKILHATQQQVSSSRQIALAMSEITAVSTQTNTVSQEVTKAAAQLAEIASELRTQVATFRLGDDAS